jgi:hypothetical protein
MARTPTTARRLVQWANHAHQWRHEKNLKVVASLLRGVTHEPLDVETMQQLRDDVIVSLSCRDDKVWWRVCRMEGRPSSSGPTYDAMMALARRVVTTPGLTLTTCPAPKAKSPGRPKRDAPRSHEKCGNVVIHTTGRRGHPSDYCSNACRKRDCEHNNKDETNDDKTRRQNEMIEMVERLMKGTMK